jgi:hypothetical protein
MKTVKLEVLKNGAIYVDDVRITNRSTKPWGGSPAVLTVNVLKREVIQTLVDNNFSIKKIDDTRYATQLEKYL